MSNKMFFATYQKNQVSQYHPKVYYPVIQRPTKADRVYKGNPQKTATNAEKFAQHIIDRMCRIYSEN